MRADKTLDCMGLVDPMPIVSIANKMKELGINEILQVVADDKGIKQDVPAFCRITGHEYLGMQESNTGIIFYVRKIK